MKTSRTHLLCILDGFGLNPRNDYNAVALAKTPVFDRLKSTCPFQTLTTFGERVGLPSGQMGNSEVGHMNIGAGRVVEQWLLKIARSLESKDYLSRKSYINFANTFSSSTALHMIGLLSPGGVHSHENHLFLLLEELCKTYNKPILLHVITDGRDTAPNLAETCLKELEAKIQGHTQVKIASVSGRYFAMDRDKRWERVSKAYKVMTGSGEKTPDSPSGYAANSYQNGVNDEFFEPIRFEDFEVQSTDNFIFWNFREDRMRQIVAALCLESFQGFSQTHATPDTERVLCFTEYDHSHGLPFLFAPTNLSNHLGEYVSIMGCSQLRLAETEKYPHVTYFFNGGVETPYEGEERVLVPSPRDVKTYDQKPQMSAFEVKDALVKAILSQQYDLIVVNFANCDMVGHTGVLGAAITAVETVDTCLGEALNALDSIDGCALILADHGNAEQMLDYETGNPHTAHTTYPVPLVLYGAKQLTLAPDGALCDIAPTLLELMGIEIPAEMTGRSLTRAEQDI